MKHYKKIAAATIGAVLLSGAGLAFADGYSSPTSYGTQFQVYNAGTSSYQGYDVDQASGYGVFASSGFDNHPVSLTIGNGLSVVSNVIGIDSVGQNQVGGLLSRFNSDESQILSVQNNQATASTSISTNASNIAANASNIASLTSTVNGFPIPLQPDWTATTTSSMSFIKNKPLIQSVSSSTDASGNLTWTFPTSYGTTTPKVIAVSEDSTSGALSNVQITAKSGTSVTIHATRLATVLGLLSLTSNPSVTVDLIATS